MKEKKLPTSRLGRFARFAALGTRATTGKLAAAFGSSAAEGAVAKAASEALGNMRGLAAKMGQMASYVDGMVPEEHRDKYEEAMGKLRAAAPTMSTEAARRVVMEELGAPPEELFGSWSDEPFASASIGQVHRATAHDGTALAVKVQFEGVNNAVEADLKNASLFGALLGPLGSKIGVKEQMAEIRARFLEELDYSHEARRQLEFRRAFDGDDRIQIPNVVSQLSARRVMSSHFAPGIDFDGARQKSPEERRAWAETLWRFVFKSLLGHGLFNADPHPGNYLFNEAGEVYFLDFGCTREVSPRNIELVRACHQAASDGDLEGLYHAAQTAFQLPTEGPSVPLANEYIRRCFEPIWTPAPYRITRQYAASLLNGLQDNAKALLKGSRKDFKPVPAEWVFFNRLQLGFYSVLARLDVEVDYNAIDAAILAETA